MNDGLYGWPRGRGEVAFTQSTKILRTVSAAAASPITFDTIAWDDLGIAKFDLFNDRLIVTQPGRYYIEAGVTDGAYSTPGVNTVVEVLLFQNYADAGSGGSFFTLRMTSEVTSGMVRDLAEVVDAKPGDNFQIFYSNFNATSPLIASAFLTVELLPPTLR